MMSQVVGTMYRFAKKGEDKVYLTIYNGDYILWIVHNGSVIQKDNFFRESEEAESAFERARNAL